MEKHIEPDLSPATLGDVLYADTSKSAVSEESWVLLVQSIAAGDQLALHALYERAHRMVFTLVMRITGSRETADELTVDVFHDVWRRASGYDASNGTVLGWIMNQARSRAIDKLRFEGRKKRVDPDAGEASPAVATDDFKYLVEQKQDKERLQRAMMVLTPGERQAIETAFFLQLSYSDVAERLNVPHGTIKTRIRSGLHKLRLALTAEARKP